MPYNNISICESVFSHQIFNWRETFFYFHTDEIKQTTASLILCCSNFFDFVRKTCVLYIKKITFLYPALLFSDCVHNVVFLDRSHCCIDFPREMPLLAGYDICSGFFIGVIYSCLLNEKCQLDVSSLYSSRCWLRHIGVDWRFHISLTQGGYEAEISTFQWYLTANLLIAHFFVNMFVNYLLCQFSRGNAKFPQRMLCKVFSEGFSSGSSFPDTKWYNMP